MPQLHCRSNISSVSHFPFRSKFRLQACLRRPRPWGMSSEPFRMWSIANGDSSHWETAIASTDPSLLHL